MSQKLASEAAADAGGLFDVVKRGGKGPGPDAYHKDALARPAQGALASPSLNGEGQGLVG